MRSDTTTRLARPGARRPVALQGSAVISCLHLATCVSLLLFVAYPLARMVGLGLAGGLSEAAATYARTLGSSLGLIRNSVLAGTLAALCSTALALAIAACASFGPAWLRGPVVGMTLLSMVSPPFVSSLAYIELFGRRGLVSHDLLGLSLNPYGWQGVVLMQTLFFTAVNVLLLASTLSRIDPTLLRAARDLGASPARALREVVLPLLAPSLAACLLLTFVRSLADYGTPVVIGGGFETISTRIYLQIVGYSDLRAASVLNVGLLVVSSLTFVLYARASRASDALVAGTMGARAEDVREALALTGAPRVALQLPTLAYLAFLAIQYLAILRSSLSRGIGLSAPLTLSNYEGLLSLDLVPLGRSIGYALAAALLGIVLSLVLVYLGRTSRSGPALDALVSLPYMLPGTCLGLGYLLAFNAAPLKLTGTAAIIVLVLAFKQLAVSARALATSLGQVSPELDMAARDLGASEPRLLLGVLLPNLREAMAVSFVNGFSSALVSYGATLFLVTPGNKIAVFVLFDSLSSGRYGRASAISVVLVAVGLCANLLFSRLVLRRGRP